MTAPTSYDATGLPRPFRNTVMAIANTPVAIVRPGGRRVVVSLFEMLVRRLAAGQTSRRISPMPFIALVIACAAENEAAPSQPEEGSAPFGKATLPGSSAPFKSRLISGTEADIENALVDLLGIIRAEARRNRL